MDSAMGSSIEILRRAIDALNEGDEDTLTKLFADNAQWHTPGKSIFSGGHIGVGAILRQFERYRERSGGTFKRELLFAATDDEGHALGVCHGDGQREHKQLDVDSCLIVQVDDGRIVDGKEYFFDLYAWDHFWT